MPAISLKAGSDINIDNDLPAISQKAGSDIYIENRLVKIKNKLVFLDDSIESIQSIPKEAKNANETNDIIYLVKNLDNKHLIEKADELSEMNSNISSLKNVYRETDKIIKDEKKKISGLYKYIRETALNYLYLEKDINIIRLKSFNRPKPILIKYNQLIRDAIKNQDIYYNLDNQYRVLQVNKARDSKNWDVITKPTLIPSPVAPHKKKMIIYGIFAGFIGGSLAGLVKDKIEDHVHSFSDITKLTSSPVLNYLSLDDDKSWEENLSIIAKGPLAERRGVTSILILGDFDKNILEDIHYKLNKYLNDIELIVTTDIIKAASSSNIIFVIGFGVTKKSKTIESMRKLNLLNKHILGTLIIST
ncbi:GNVR domain-containing protein [Prochlorococcus sp. MIT 1011]|uniref:GNVR domain-containing protein n=1 Tax=Prochlorococcus sp. MIT 1011 TaxID=3082520 RepID=UPI0039B6D10E